MNRAIFAIFMILMKMQNIKLKLLPQRIFVFEFERHETDGRH